MNGLVVYYVQAGNRKTSGIVLEILQDWKSFLATVNIPDTEWDDT